MVSTKANAARATKGPNAGPSPAPTKENRYLRAFRLIGAEPTITAETIARRTSMSVSMANACITAWNAAVNVLDGRSALAVDASDLMTTTKGGVAPWPRERRPPARAPLPARRKQQTRNRLRRSYRQINTRRRAASQGGFFRRHAAVRTHVQRCVFHKFYTCTRWSP